ncbi:MAG: sulfatase-like hydrolase/transferase, partial [Gammaproteobacteria bacterium]
MTLIAFAVLAFPFLDGGELARAHAPALSDKAKPNILFVLMDDVGIDQMRVFGYGGATPPKMPNINAIALAGVRFRNTWSMPECSPSRAALLTGRYPLRNNIYQAIGPNDLANSQVSPYEITAPRVLRTRGYTSALFGKFHLGGPENNPFGNGTPQSLGFDYFYGYVGGLPGSIDRTAGGVAPEDTYQCGFVTDADFGACHYADGRCQDLSNAPLPGKICLERGGILVPNALCANSSNAGLNFDVQNAYYVSPVVENRSEGKVQQLALSNARARKYR